MVNSVLNFLIQYKYILIFYLIIIVFLILKRKRLDIQAKFIILYRMKWGLKWMDTFSSKYREWVILLGYISVGAGYVGLIIISYILIKNLYDLFTVPAVVSGVSLVLPGVNVPGLGVLPFWYWLLSIFLIAIVHEFSHGIVARAHNVPVKNTGIVFFGPIMGAFVEPDEKKLSKEKDIVQYSVLAAGTFSNILLAIVALLCLTYVFNPIEQTMLTPTGFTFESYYNESLPIAQAGIIPGTLITGINGATITNFNQFNEKFFYTRPGDKITVNTPEKDYPITLAPSPDNAQKSFLGITSIKNQYDVKPYFRTGIGHILLTFLDWFTGLQTSIPGFLTWLFLLSFGIGLFNLLPLPIVDGGRMVQVFLHKLKGPIVGEKRYQMIGLFFLLILILNLVFPLVMKLF